MFELMRRMRLPATAKLFVVVVALIAATPSIGRADDAMVDVRTLPRLAGAVEDAARSDSYSLSYGVPTAEAATIPAIRKLLVADGWRPYVEPLEETGTFLAFKKGRQGLHVSFSQGLGRPDQSVVSYTANRIYASLPFPEEATEIVFDGTRPYLSCVVAGTIEATLAFLKKELLTEGWSPLSADTISTHWPNAGLGAMIKNDARAFFGNADDKRRLPIMVSLQRRADGRTGVDIRTAPFALPQDLRAGPEMAGLPRPERTKSVQVTGSSSSDRREMKAAVIAEIPVVLAFYRRELAAGNWKEESVGAVVTADEVVLNFSSPEESATLKLGHKYDLTIVGLVTQVKAAALAARAKAKKEADDKFMADAMATAKQMIAADEARRAAQAANLSDAPLRALAGQTTPVPLPETAENIQFNGGDGKLEFDSSSSVKALAAFYRGSLTSLGWKEQPSVINKSNMAVMEFAKGGKKLSVTAMQMGPRVNVTADGSALVMAEAPAPHVSSASGTRTAVKNLEADPDSLLPVPKQHTMSSLGTGKAPGSETPFRKELEASVPAELSSVLAFYRDELGKLGWKEAADRAVIKPDQVQLAFAAPDGPATLKLGRSNGETTVNLAQKIPAAAAKSEVLPKPGQARLMLSNLANSEATLTINKQTIRIAAGAGGPQAKGPALDLPPGKYQYSLKVAGGPVRSYSIDVAADDAWGMVISPAGEVMSLQVY